MNPLNSTLLLIFISFSMYGQDANLLIHYTFNNDFQDQSINQFHGTAENVNFVNDRFDLAQGAASFTGTSCIEFPNDQMLKPQFPFSFSFWINPQIEFIRAEGIVGTDQFRDNYFGAFISILNSGKMMLGYGDGCGETGPTCRISEVSDRIFNNNEWYHIGAIFKSSSEIELYVNGCKESTTPSGTGTQQLAYSSEPGAIGKKDHSDIVGNPIGYYHGVIDDFYYWDRVIKEEDILELVDNFFISEDSTVEYTGCQGDGYEIEVNGTIYNESNPSGIETNGNTGECLTNVEVNLVFLSSDLSSIEESICEGESITIGGQSYSNEGNFTQNFVNSNGCDSIVNISILMQSILETDLQYNICEGESIEVGGQSFSNAGNFTQSFSSVNGCDSIVNISITMQSAIRTDRQYNICEGESIEVGGQSYSNSGNFTQNYLQSNGCDSIVNISITMQSAIRTDLQYNICEGESIEVGGQSYSSAGNFTQILSSTNGCDSILNININLDNFCSDCVFDTEFKNGAIVLKKLNENSLNVSLVQGNEKKIEMHLTASEFLQFSALYLVDNEMQLLGDRSKISELMNDAEKIEDLISTCNWNSSRKFTINEITSALPFAISDIPKECNLQKLNWLFTWMLSESEALIVGGTMKLNFR